MSELRPIEAGYDAVQDGSMPATAAMPSPLDRLFPPEKERVDAPPPSTPKHEFETENRRSTDWPRRRAIAIDNLILFGVFVLLTRAIRGYLGAGVFTVALALTYFFVMEATTGQTIGKRMMRLRVVMRDGRPAPANAVAARTVLRLIDVLPFGWILGGLAMLLTGGRRQRIGDLAARTCVRRDDRPMPRAPHSPLVGLYPILWIGMSLAVMWHVNLFGPHIEVSGKRTSNPYMAKVDQICERRVNSESALGRDETSAQATALWAEQMGAIDSLPAPPPSARHDMRIVKRTVSDTLHFIGRQTSAILLSSDKRKIASAELLWRKRYKKMQTTFRSLGLPYCAQGLHGVG